MQYRIDPKEPSYAFFPRLGWERTGSVLGAFRFVPVALLSCASTAAEPSCAVGGDCAEEMNFLVPALDVCRVQRPLDDSLTDPREVSCHDVQIFHLLQMPRLLEMLLDLALGSEICLSWGLEGSISKFRKALIVSVPGRRHILSARGGDLCCQF